MSPRRLACVLLGAWLGGAVLMGWVAMESFRSVDRVLREPVALNTTQYQKLGHDAVRQLLRYQVSEQNRFLFERWELAQIALGLFIFGLLLFGTSVGKTELSMPLLMLVFVAVSHWLIRPQILALGRLLDFLPASAPALEETRLRAMHTAYTVIELLKLGVGMALSALLIWRHSRRSRVGNEIHAVHDSNHRHING